MSEYRDARGFSLGALTVTSASDGRGLLVSAPGTLLTLADVVRLREELNAFIDKACSAPKTFRSGDRVLVLPNHVPVSERHDALLDPETAIPVGFIAGEGYARITSPVTATVIEASAHPSVDHVGPLLCVGIDGHGSLRFYVRPFQLEALR